jgi:radical SAM protein with 4Fe4S-binding SPASM domain
VVDLINFFYETYGIGIIHAVSVLAPAGSPFYVQPNLAVDAFREAAVFTVRNLAIGRTKANTLSLQMLLALRNRTPVHRYCPAGTGTLSVASDGYLYPCFLFNGDKRFRMCRFLADGRMVEDRVAQVYALLHMYDKKHCRECSFCWAAPVCQGCAGGDLIETGKLGCHSKCRLMRSVADSILLETAKTN